MRETIDMTPTWRDILPALLMVHENATTPGARKEAYAELCRMADIADRYVMANRVLARN